MRGSDMAVAAAPWLVARPGGRLSARHRHPARRLRRSGARPGALRARPQRNRQVHAAQGAVRLPARGRARSAWAASPARGRAARDGPARRRLPSAAPEPLSPSQRRGEPAPGRVALPRRSQAPRGAGGPGARAVPGAGGEAAAARRHAQRRPAAPAGDRAQPDARPRPPAHRRADRRRRAARGRADLRPDPEPRRPGQGDPAGRPEHQARARDRRLCLRHAHRHGAVGRPREDFGGDTEALVARWLYASRDASA